MIRVAEPVLMGREREYVMDCLARTELTMGSYVSRFESAFAEATRTRHALACMNGTVALHLSLLAMMVQPGDEVIVPAFTYIATANAVTYCGAKPVFVDIEPDTWCMDPDKVLQAIRPGITRAILPVHMYGVPADMDRLRNIANLHNVGLIEDAAEAHGAMHRGRPVGGLGNLGVFSFYGNKIITCGEGGMVTTNDDTYAERIRLFRGQGMSTTRRYYHPVIGYNYRMTNIQAAIGLGQLETLSWHQERRHEVVHEYKHWFRGINIDFQSSRFGTAQANWMFTILVPRGVNRDKVMREMESAGVETRPTFVPMTHMPMYDQDQQFPVTEDIAARGINLPTSSALTQEQIRTVCVAATLAMDIS